MKKIHSLLIVTSIFLLASCGGGGGGSGSSSLGPPPELYDGPITAAVITSDNSMSFVNLAFGTTPSPPDINLSTSASTTLVAEKTANIFSAATAAVNGSMVNGSEPGLVSGTMSYSGNINQDMTGSITFTFTNYNNGDGYTYDGKMILDIFTVDQSTLDPIHSRFTFWLLQITSSTDNFTLSGTIDSILDSLSTTETDTFNLDGTDNTSGNSFRYENLIIATTCDSLYTPTYCSQNASGRLFLEPDGYVDLSMTTPAEMNYIGQFNVDVPDAGGPVYLTGGQQTGIKITLLSISEVQLDVDTDMDPDYEYSDIYRWHDLVGLVLIWDHIYGPPATFDVALSATETVDGDFVATGWSNTGATNGLDFMLLKTDAAGGEIWTKFLGTVEDEYGEVVRQTSDGGFILTGYRDASPNRYGIVYKTDTAGVEVWNRSFSDITANRTFDIQPTVDGGYIVAGYRYGPAGDGYTGQDIYLVKLGADGSIVWEKTYDNGGVEIGYSVAESASGGYIVVGTFNDDIMVIRTDAAGTLAWQATFGGTYTQYGYDLVEDANGDIVVAGNSSTASGSVYTIYKLNSTGALLWQNGFDSTTQPYTRNSIAHSGNGGYVMVATDTFDVELFSLDSSGNVTWSKTYNWSNFTTMCTGTSIEKTSDGGYIIGGSAWPSEGKDFYLIKTDANGNITPAY